MSAVNVPANKNFLSPLGFRFTLARAPNLSYNIQRVTIPGVELSSSSIPTPFIPIPTTDSISFNSLNVTFRVSEDLDDYLEIHNWMIGLGSPTSFEQYKALQNANPGDASAVLSDITVLIMNSSMRPNIKINFHDAFPVTIGDLEFNTTDSDVNYIECTAQFRYLKYDIELIS